HRTQVAQMNHLVRAEHPHVDEIIRPLANTRDVVGRQSSGVLIYPAGRADIFEGLGLRPGDQLVAVNGTELKSVQQGSALLASLGSVPVAQLTVIREGVPRQIVVHTAQIEEEAKHAEAGLAGEDSTEVN